MGEGLGREVGGEEESERRETKSWVWARARAEERVPMCRVRFVCVSEELGGGGASGLLMVRGAAGISVGRNRARGTTKVIDTVYAIKPNLKGPKIRCKMLSYTHEIFPYLVLVNKFRCGHGLNWRSSSIVMNFGVCGIFF